MKQHHLDCLARNSGTGDCTTYKQGNRFCVKHHGQHLIGIIDKNGNKLREKYPNKKYTKCQAINSTESCSKYITGRFCIRHANQFESGLIDATGNKLREKYNRKYTNCVAVNSGTTCSPPWKKGRFCLRHYQHYHYGIIDYYSNKLRDLKKNYKH